MYKNNICPCGKVINIIQEDEEEYDEEGKVCLISNTGNHHFVKGMCKYCESMQTRRVSFVKQINQINSIKRMSAEEIEVLIAKGNELISSTTNKKGDILREDCIKLVRVFSDELSAQMTNKNKSSKSIIAEDKAFNSEANESYGKTIEIIEVDAKEDEKDLKNI